MWRRDDLATLEISARRGRRSAARAAGLAAPVPSVGEGPQGPNSGGFWQATIDSLRQRVAVLDERGVIIALNAAWRAFAEDGAGAEGAIARNYVATCLASEDPAGARIARGLSEMLSGERLDFELEYPSHGGELQRWFLIRATRHAGPGPLRVVVVHEEVSDGRQARDQALVQAALLDQLDASVIVTDIERRVRSWNSGAEALYGWTREEALGRDAMDLIVPEDTAPAEELLAELHRERRWDGEFLLRRKDGETFTAYVRNRVICDEDGTPTAIVGVSLDISERVAAESELVRSRDYARAVAECMGEGLFTLDLDGRLTYVNPAAEASLGWPREALLGKMVLELIRPRDAAATIPEESPITRSLASGETMRVKEEIFTVRSGRELPVAYSATPFWTGEGVQGCVVIFQDISERKRHEAEQHRSVATLATINRVEQAIVEDRFELYAQPLVDLSSGETVKHELLLRMRERDGTIVAPGAFLRVAEKYALVGEIDWWVIKRATQIAALGSPVQLNISARSIGDLDVLEHIERSIEQSGADPGRLVFEITETAIAEDEAAARHFAERLHALGCGLALDDFGTGYGGFTYLKQIPADYLKIDIEFVRDLLANLASRHVVQAVLALARDFEMQTVAEGVEDQPTLDLLREMGVDFAQGYHIARPEPFGEVPGDGASAPRVAVSL